VAATVFPDFANAQICERYGTLDALEVPGRMLKAGEYTALLNAISDLSGFNNRNEEKDKKIKN
jgi:phage xkdN-like protein